jgi:dTDP-4-amino-4,6-dideoxy-D-galactose acyltransferase
MEDNGLCQFLDWDSNFFGIRVARVNVNRLNKCSIIAIDDWCCDNKIDCLYFLADADDGDTIRLAEDDGYHLVDIRVIFKRHVEGSQGRIGKCINYVIRPSVSTDIPTLRSIAKVSFRITRFYYDANFPTELCDALYETWIEKSCTRNDETVLVAENQDNPIGFISCKLVNQNQGEIGLVGVRPDWQGKGLGLELINEALFWFSGKGVSQVKVITQGRNSQAQRLYQRCGFLTDTIQIWYHKWFKKLYENY